MSRVQIQMTDTRIDSHLVEKSAAQKVLENLEDDSVGWFSFANERLEKTYWYNKSQICMVTIKWEADE